MGECFASNTYLARMMGSTPANVANEISKLRKKGLVLDWGFDGRKRQITVAREVHPNPFGTPEEGSATTEGRIQRPVNIDTRVGSSKSEETKETASKEAVEKEVIALWRPDQRTKEEKLRTLRNPRKIPSEREFDNFLMDEEMDEIVNKRSNLYDTLAGQKFHHWNPKLKKWVPIRNWKEYVTALNRKISSVF